MVDIVNYLIGRNAPTFFIGDVTITAYKAVYFSYQGNTLMIKKSFDHGLAYLKGRRDSEM